MGVTKLPCQLLDCCSLVSCRGGGRGDHTAQGTDCTDALVGCVSIGLLCGFIQLGVGN